MPSEEDLRSALNLGVASIYPDVDSELDRVLGRATRRAVTRRTSYAAGLAAAVALAVVLLGHDWRPQAAEPEPMQPIPVRDLPSGVGQYALPADLAPGRYRVDFLPDRWPPHRVQAVVDVPGGWGQDDRFALATGPAGEAATRRLDFITGRDARLAWCAGSGLGREPSTLDIAEALGSVSAMSAGAPQPATVGGHPGYLVKLRDDPVTTTSPCGDSDTHLYNVPGFLQRCRGFTTLAWVLDLDGRLVSVFASYGPDTSTAQTEELVRMVETAQITIR